VYLNPEATVVGHPHQVPGDVEGLGVGTAVPGATEDGGGGAELGDGDGEGPKDPAPMHPVAVRGEGTVDVGADPRGTLVQRHLDSRHRMASARVGVSLHEEVAGEAA